MKKTNRAFRLTLSEIFLLELCGWLGLWLLNDYLATLLTTIITTIVFAILVIVLIAEALERSKVPRWYFWVMGLSVIAPLLAALLYTAIFGGRLEFLR